MRKLVKGKELALRAIAGSEVVLLAISASPTARKGLRGFAIGEVQAGGEVKWYSGAKCFKKLEPNPQAGSDFSCLDHPIQSFLWGDYAADPGTTYRYRVAALYGEIGALNPGETLDIQIRTEDPAEGAHGVYFNRGAIASQGFAAKFKNKAPANIDDPTDPEVVWLSRGLLEGCLSYIAQATKGDELLVAAYEFTYAPVLLALKDAAKRGAKVSIVHEAGDGRDSKTGKVGPTHATTGALKAIKTHGLDKQPGLKLIKRTKRNNIPHNKFIVLVRGGKAIQVFSGSTNFTPSGFLGQTNVGHVVRDEGVAGAFRDYWLQLSGDPTTSALATWSEAKLPQDQVSKSVATNPVTPLFSPRRDDDMLVWYADELAKASETAMFTAAFGVNKLLAAQFAIDRPFVRFVLLEDPPNADLQAKLKNDPDVIAAYGSILGRGVKPSDAKTKLERWFIEEDLFRRNGNVFFIHTKFLMIDPLGNKPLTFTGSANFSSNSLVNNDENMLLISAAGGGAAEARRVADIYLTEFDRIFRHFYARQSINRIAGAGGSVDGSKFLDETGRWLDGFTKPRRMKTNRQRLFFPNWPN